MKRKLWVVALVCSTSAAWATLVTDDFDRPNVDYTNDTSQIGAHWQQDRPTNLWQLNGASKEVFSDINDKEAVLYNDELALASGGGDSFTFSLDYAARHDATIWGGIAWNYQDKDNFYALRYKNTTTSFQLLTRRNDGWTNVSSGNATEAFANNGYYTFEITSSNPYDFGYSITKVSDSTVVASGTYNPAGSDFTGGYAGFYQSDTGGAHAKFDNFSLEVIPEPATLGLVGMVGAAAFVIRKRFMV